MLLAAAAWGTSGTSQALAGFDAPVVVGAARTVSGGVALWLAAATVARRGRPGAAARRDRRGGAPASTEDVTVASPGVETAAAPTSATASVTPARSPTAAVVVAGLAVTVSQIAFFAAVAITGVAVGTVVAIGSAPIVAGLLSWLVDHRRPTTRWWGATALAVTGVALVLLVGASGPSVEAAGVALALLAGSAYGVVTVASRRVLDAGLSPTGAMARVFVVGTVPALVVLLLGDATPLLSGRGAVLVLWLGVVTVAVPYLLFAAGLRTLSPATVGTLTLAEPLVAAGLGVALLGERPGPWSVVGAVLLCVGLVLAAGDGRRAAVPGP